MDISPVTPQFIAIAVAFVAMITDSRWGRIYNWLTFPAMLTGWILSAILYGLPGLGYSFAATVFGIILYIYLIF